MLTKEFLLISFGLHRPRADAHSRSLPSLIVNCIESLGNILSVDARGGEAMVELGDTGTTGGDGVTRVPLDNQNTAPIAGDWIDSLFSPPRPNFDFMLLCRFALQPKLHTHIAYCHLFVTGQNNVVFLRT